MPSFSDTLEDTLHRSLAIATSYRHQYATLEHLLSALIDDPFASEALAACGCNLTELQAETTKYLSEELSSLSISIDRPNEKKTNIRRKKHESVEDFEKRKRNVISPAAEWDEFKKEGPTPTSGFQRVVQRAILHASNANIDTVDGGGILIALFSERESYAVYFLQKQNISRLDILTFISNNRNKTDGNEAKYETKDQIKVVNIVRIKEDLRSLSDLPSLNPALHTPKIAQKLVEFIEDLLPIGSITSGSSSSSITVGIYGPWGSGKSTLLAKITSEIRKEGAIVVHINAWKWDGAQDIYDFVNDQLVDNLATTKGYRFKASILSALLALRRRSKILFSMTTAAVGLGIFGYFVDFDAENLKESISKGSAWGAIGAGLSAILSRPIASFVEKLLLKAKDSDDAVGKLSASYRYLLLTKRIGRSKNRPIFFIFDDLDRCKPENILKILHSIHRLTVSGSVNIIGCDEKIVSSAIYHENREIADLSGEGMTFGDRFLEKIVQVHFRMPDLTEGDLMELGLVSHEALERQRPLSMEAENASLMLSGAPQDQEALSDLKKDLGESFEHVDEISLANIRGEVLGAITELYRLPIRKIKFLSNIIKLYTMVFPPIDAESAYRVSAFIGIANIDRGWFQKHIENKDKWDGPERLKKFHERIIRYMGDDHEKIRIVASLYGLEWSEMR
jgi:hypothetical protein